MNRLTSLSAWRSSVGVACLAALGCTGSAAAPTPDPGAPVLTCPGSITQSSPLGIPRAVTYNLPAITGGLGPVTGPSCNPPPGSTFGQGSTTITCTATDAKQRVGMCSFSVTVAYPPKLTATRFIAFGDSQTWGEDGQNSTTTMVAGTPWHTLVQLPFPDTYPGALQIDLVGRYSLQSPTVRNDGKPGEALLDPMQPARIRFNADLAPGASQYDAVLIMEGANDLNRNDAAIEPAMIGQLGSMIDFARSVGVKPFLATLPLENPAGCCPVPRGRGAALVPGFNDQVRALALSKSVPVVDVYQAFADNLGLVGPDGLHPTADGYHVIAQAFLKAIEQALEAAPTPTATPVKSPTGPGHKAFRRPGS